MAHRVLPSDGKMLLHTIVSHHPDEWKRMGIPLLMSRVRFIYFIGTEIFPGGRLPSVPMVDKHAALAGFHITRHHSLQPHYARTLDCWATNLAAHEDEAISVQSQEVYDRYIKYLTGCAEGFRKAGSTWFSSPAKSRNRPGVVPRRSPGSCRQVPARSGCAGPGYRRRRGHPHG